MKTYIAIVAALVTFNLNAAPVVGAFGYGLGDPYNRKGTNTSPMLDYPKQTNPFYSLNIQSTKSNLICEVTGAYEHKGAPELYTKVKAEMTKSFTDKYGVITNTPNEVVTGSGDRRAILRFNDEKMRIEVRYIDLKLKSDL